MTFKRPEVLCGRTYKLRSSCGNIYVTINGDCDMKPVEAFVILGKSGACGNSTANGLGRTISISLQNGTPTEALSRTLGGINCRESLGGLDSCLTAISKALRLFEEEMR